MAALKLTGGVAVFSLALGMVYALVQGGGTEELLDDTGYILVSAPFAAAVLYWIVGGLVSGITSVFGLSEAPKDDEKIIDDVLDDEDDEG